MLGMFPEAAYSSVEIRISPEIAVCLYTDGLSKPRKLRRRIRQGARKEFLERQLDVPALVSLTPLLANIAGFSRHNSARAQEDDITLLVLDLQ